MVKKRTYARCPKCNGIVAENLLVPEQYDNQCPLCDYYPVKDSVEESR